MGEGISREVEAAPQSIFSSLPARFVSVSDLLEAKKKIDARIADLAARRHSLQDEGVFVSEIEEVEREIRKLKEHARKLQAEIMVGKPGRQGGKW